MLTRSLFVVVFFIACFATLPAKAQDDGPVGSVTREVPDQIGMYEVKLDRNTRLQPADVVTLVEGDTRLGEALVSSLRGDFAVVNLRGVFPVKKGSKVFLARRRSDSGGQVAAVSETPEYRLAVGRWGQLVARHNIRLTENAVYAQRVQAIGEQVAMASGNRAPWRFYVMVDSRPNAFTTGEGVVVVTEGLLDVELTDHELAGVLAHEIAHSIRRHTMRNEDRAYQLQAARRELQEARELLARFQVEKAREEEYMNKPAYVETQGYPSSQGYPNSQNSPNSPKSTGVVEYKVKNDFADIKHGSKMATVRRKIASAEQKLKAVGALATPATTGYGYGGSNYDQPAGAAGVEAELNSAIARLEQAAQAQDVRGGGFGNGGPSAADVAGDWDAEREADIAGLRYAAAAGFEATGLLDALNRLSGRGFESFGATSELGGTTFGLFSHPSTTHRVQVLRKVLNSWRS